MIVLDTNVISEAMKPDQDASVRAWINRQTAETLYLSTITLAEVQFGIFVMPEGARKAKLATAWQDVLALFRGRVLPFDEDAALHYSEMAISARVAGKGFPLPDSYIAAIAFSRGFVVASRDAAPFMAGGVNVINPWQDGA